MIASFESKEERYNDAKPVIDLKQISRADGDRPEEINMVSKKNSFDGILDILENLVVGVTKTINVVNTISLFTDEKKLEEIKQNLKEKKQEKITQQAKTTERNIKNEQIEENKAVKKEVTKTFIDKINSKNTKSSTQPFKI